MQTEITPLGPVLLIVESASIGHDELDKHVLVACGARKMPSGRWRIGEGDGVQLTTDFAKVTQSVDAALSLLEDVLPGWNFRLLRCAAKLQTSTDAVPQDRLPNLVVSADAATLPLAICAAILKALPVLADARAKHAAI